MTSDAMLARIREEQATSKAICERLLGLSDTEARAIVEPLGYFVELVRMGTEAVLTLDMRTDRVRLFVDDGDVVQGATVG